MGKQLMEGISNEELEKIDKNYIKNIKPNYAIDCIILDVLKNNHNNLYIKKDYITLNDLMFDYLIDKKIPEKLNFSSSLKSFLIKARNYSKYYRIYENTNYLPNKSQKAIEIFNKNGTNLFYLRGFRNVYSRMSFYISQSFITNSHFPDINRDLAYEKIPNTNKEKATYYIYFSGGLGCDVELNDTPHFNNKIELYPLQSPWVKSKIEYTIIGVLKFRHIKPFYNFIKTDNHFYIMKYELDRVYLIEGQLPFDDIIAIMFPEILKALKGKNYILYLKTTVIKIESKSIPIEKVKDNTLFGNISGLVHNEDDIKNFRFESLASKFMVIPDCLISEFNLNPYSDQELFDLFNPKVNEEPKNTQNSNILSDTDTDPDTDEEPEEIPEPIIETPEPEPIIEELKFIYSYNKYQVFNNKAIMEKSIQDLIKVNNKAKKLFEKYTQINFIKDFSLDYKKQKYFNIILYDRETNEVSPQYHLYLNAKNEITNITAIQSLI